jgi:hypothetical protein
MGTQLTKASIFLSVGLLMGALVGGGGVAAVALGSSPAQSSGGAAAAPGATPDGSPVIVEPTPTASATPRATTVSNDVPALSRSALLQSVVLNARLVTSASSLNALLNAKPFDPFEVSQVLRSMSADAVVGHALTPHLASWSAGKPIATDLNALYLSVQTTAAEGLGASIRNERAYKLAATNMVRLLGEVGAVDAELRAAALAAGVELPVATPAPWSRGARDASSAYRAGP